MEPGQHHQQQQQQNQHILPSRRRLRYRDIVLDALEDEKYYNLNNKNYGNEYDDELVSNSSVVTGVIVCQVHQPVREVLNTDDKVALTKQTLLEIKQQKRDLEAWRDDSRKKNGVTFNDNDGDEANDISNISKEGSDLILNRTEQKRKETKGVVCVPSNDWEDSFEHALATLELETSMHLMTSAANKPSTATTLFPSLTDIEEIVTPECQQVFQSVDAGYQSRYLEYNGIHYQEGDSTHTGPDSFDSFYIDNSLDNVTESINSRGVEVPALSALEYRVLRDENSPGLHPGRQGVLDRDWSYDENDFEIEHAYRQSLSNQDRMQGNNLVSPTSASYARYGFDDFALYPDQRSPYRTSSIYPSDHGRNYHPTGPRWQDDTARYRSTHSPSNNIGYHHFHSNDNDLPSRAVSNRFSTRLRNDRGLYIGSDHIRPSLYHSHDDRRDNLFRTSSMKTERTEILNSSHFSDVADDDFRGAFSHSPTSSFHSRATAILDTVRDAVTTNKDVIEIEVSPGVFLPLHGSEDTQQAMYEALSLSFNNNKNKDGSTHVSANGKTGLIKCVCLSCSAKIYCIRKAVAFVCYKCLEISPITSENNSSTTNDINTSKQHGIGLGISEQSYRELEADIYAKFNKEFPSNENRSPRIHKISLMRPND